MVRRGALPVRAAMCFVLFTYLCVYIYIYLYMYMCVYIYPSPLPPTPADQNREPEVLHSWEARSPNPCTLRPNMETPGPKEHCRSPVTLLFALAASLGYYLVAGATSARIKIDPELVYP